MNRTAHLCIYAFVLVFMAGCALCPPKNDESMLSLADSLTKLSAKVESVVRYGNPPENATSDDLLKMATERDPHILENLAGYKLRVLSRNRHAIVLLCSADGKRGLLEDLGCTGRLDRNLWREEAAMPCEFTLSVELGCKDK